MLLSCKVSLRWAQSTMCNDSLSMSRTSRNSSTMKMISRSTGRIRLLLGKELSPKHQLGNCRFISECSSIEDVFSRGSVAHVVRPRCISFLSNSKRMAIRVDFNSSDDKVTLFIDIFLASLCLMSRITKIEARPMPQHLHAFHLPNHLATAFAKMCIHQRIPPPHYPLVVFQPKPSLK